MITILGAGISGLTLARILHLNGIVCTVYDADVSATSRHQGGMLNINNDTGQKALYLARLDKAFRAHTLPGADALRIIDKTATLRMQDPGQGDRPEIDRGTLRRLFVDAIPEGVIRWNSKVTAVEKVAEGFKMTFADRKVEVVQTLIGADGAWSKVRPLLSDALPQYSGISFVELRYPNADKAYPVAYHMVGAGLMFALSDERGFIGHREPDSALCIYAAVKVPEGWHKQPITRALLAEFFADWHPDFHTVLEKSDGDLMSRPLYALPVGHRWNRLPGVTLLGDAAHVMSPFAGEGVNLAMIDAADLAEALIAHPGDVEAALALYEAKMFPRAKEMARLSADNLDIAFAPNTPQGFLDIFASYGLGLADKAQG